MRNRFFWRACVQRWNLPIVEDTHTHKLPKIILFKFTVVWGHTSRMYERTGSLYFSPLKSWLMGSVFSPPLSHPFPLILPPHSEGRSIEKWTRVDCFLWYDCRCSLLRKMWRRVSRRKGHIRCWRILILLFTLGLLDLVKVHSLATQ